MHGAARSVPGRRGSVFGCEHSRGPAGAPAASAWSAPAGSAPCSGRPCSGPATASSRCRGVSEASRTRAATLLPGVPGPRGRGGRGAAELRAAHRARRRPGRPRGRARHDRRVAGRASSSCTPPAATASACSTPRSRSTSCGLALHPAMTFTGTALDLDRLADCCFGVTAPEPLRPVAEALVLEIGRRAGLGRGGRRGRSTTRRSRTARTTWSPSSPSRCRCWRRPGVEAPGPGARPAAVRGARQRAAPRVTLPSPGRWRAAMPVPWPSTCAQLRDRSPRTSGRPTWRWPGRRRSGRWPAAGCAPPPPSRCSTSSPSDQERSTTATARRPTAGRRRRGAGRARAPAPSCDAARAELAAATSPWS